MKFMNTLAPATMVVGIWLTVATLSWVYNPKSYESKQQELRETYEYVIDPVGLQPYYTDYYEIEDGFVSFTSHKGQEVKIAISRIEFLGREVLK